MGGLDLTVSAGLHGSFDVTDALDGDTVLVVAVDELIFQLTDLVDQNTELIRDIRHVLVAGLTPQGQLLLQEHRISFFNSIKCVQRGRLGIRHTATSMRSRATSSMLRMTFFSILTSCDSLRARSGPKAPAAFLRKACPEQSFSHCSFAGGGGRVRDPVAFPRAEADTRLGIESLARGAQAGRNSDQTSTLNAQHLPMPPFPSQRLDLVVDIGGGGFSICAAVGARDWRIE